MKVSKNWLQELVDLNIPINELIDLLPLRTIGIKEVTANFIELDMKGYNRADLLSLRGVASEVAAITDSKVLFEDPQEADFAWTKTNLASTEVKVEDSDLCPYYTVTKIEGLKVGKSSPDVIKRLADSGMRSVDNVTDITNLIMQEYGQPMHAFDAGAVKDETIIVRSARPGETITTLDGKIRNLDTADLLIADSQSPLGIAGVMGGKDSEINESTTTILLEAAIFDPINIRKTVTHLGLPSEASKRFQHGLTKKRLLQALNAAIKMYEQLGGKVTVVTMVGSLEDKVKKITLRKEKLEELVGVKFEDSQVEEYLEKLNFKVKKMGEDWEVEPPYYRLDINLDVDVIEEVARMYGYEKIPSVVVSESKPLQKEGPIFQRIADLKSKLVDLGLTEVQTYSFYSTAVITALGWDDTKEKLLVKVANPISLETEFLRQSIWPNLLEVVGKNLRKGFKDIAVFEIGKAFNNIDGNPSEDYKLAIALSNETDNPLEELYQVAQSLGSNLGGCKLNQQNPPAVAAHLFHPKRFIAIQKDGKQIGGVSEVHLRVLNMLGIEKRVAVLEIELERNSYSN